LEPKKLSQLNVAGGNIRNIALNAAFLAADSGKPVQMGHVLQSARLEAQKIEPRCLSRKSGGGHERDPSNHRRLALKGFDAADRKAVVEGLRAELTRVLSDPAARAEWAKSRRTLVLRLGTDAARTRTGRNAQTRR
jgi:hypothetical protein